MRSKDLVGKFLMDFGKRLRVLPMYIEPGNPWENCYIESFKGKMWDELLNGEIFYSLKEAQVLIEMWRRHYNTIRPHSSLKYYPPVPGCTDSTYINPACWTIIKVGTTFGVRPPI